MEQATLLDAKDTLSSFRNQFFIPQMDGKDSVYLCGNSLGLQSTRVQRYVQEELDAWAHLAVDAHFESKRPWVSIDERVAELSAVIVGAQREEVAIMNSLTVNLHLLFLAFYAPNESRFKVLMEEGAFPSDRVS
jgi:kynureninase